MKWYHNGVTDIIMSVTLILISIGEIYLMNVSHDTVVSNKHEEQTRHYYVNFQHYYHVFYDLQIYICFFYCWSKQNQEKE